MTTSDLISDLWQSLSHGWMKLSRLSNRFFMSRYFYLFLFCLAALVVVSEKQVEGAVLFIGIICLALVLCEDILSTTLPFLLMCVFVCQCYDSFDIFIGYAWIAAPVLFSLLFHFIVYRKPLQIGSTFWGLIAVSAALILGGVGLISPEDYFRPMTLYYTVFLSVGMVVAYLLLKSQICVKREYDVKEKFLSLLYIMGMFTCFMVFHFTLSTWELMKEIGEIPWWQPSNNTSTFLMIALPCPFFFVSRNRAHMLAPFVMLAAIFLSGSRAGLILGSAEMVLCLLLTTSWDTKRRFLYVCFAVSIVGLGLWKGQDLLQAGGSFSWQSLLTKDEARFLLLSRVKELFLANPIFGHGLGYSGNTDIYSPVKGAMEWYHMMIPQVVGSMGILGVLAYSSQLVLQIRATVLPFRTLTNEQRGVRMTLAMSYLGLLLMSQLNPGIFCPLPYTLIGTMVFALIDGNSGTKRLQKKL